MSTQSLLKFAFIQKKGKSITEKFNYVLEEVGKEKLSKTQ